MTAKHPDYSGKGKYLRKQAARRAKGNSPVSPKDPPSARGQRYATVQRPGGAEWEVRRNRVLAKAAFTLCLYCGRLPVNPVVAHLVSLSEGQHLGIATNDIRHPLNAEANLVPVCKYCNMIAGTASVWTGRAKVADKLGTDRPYSGPVPDTTAVQAALDALRAQKVPDAAAGRAESLTTTAARCPYKTVQEAITDLEYPPGSEKLARGDAAQVWEWQEAGLLSCKCGPATGEESAACWVCNPLIRPLRG